MNFKRSNTKSENSFSKDLSGQPAQKTEKSQSQRNMLQSKSFSAKGSRTPGSFSNSRDNSFRNKDQGKKNLAKSVIKQNLTGSIKDWNDLTPSSDLQHASLHDIDLSEVPEEKVVEYESHFPALGGLGETPKAEGTFNPDVLKSSNIVKVLSMKDSSTSSPTRSERSHNSEGFHLGKDLQHGFESELTGFYHSLLDGEASLAEKVQAGEGKEHFEESLTTQTNTENNVLEDPLHIPNDDIRSDALRESESDLLRTPLNSEVEESEPLFVRIPLELTLTEYKEDVDRVMTPTHKVDRIRYQANLFSMVNCQTKVGWQPDNFTEAMQIMLSPVKEKETPTLTEEKLASELEQELEIPAIINKVDTEVLPVQQKEKPATLESPTLAEEKLASEIEQEELVREIILEMNPEVFIGEEQKMKAAGIDIPEPTVEEQLGSELLQEINNEGNEELENKSVEGVVPSTQPEKLASEIEQEEAFDEMKRNIEPSYSGDVQKARQDAMRNDVNLIESITQAAAEMVERPMNSRAIDPSEVFERKTGEIQFERTRQSEEKPLMKRRAAIPEPELEQVEENIVVSEEPVGHSTPIKDSKHNLKKSDASLMDHSKMSLEHLAEESPLNATRSTDAALSVHRIDIIKEEAAEVLYSSNNILFKEIDDNLQQVQEHKRKDQYHPAIFTLKKNLAILDAHMLKKEDFSVKEMNRALIECNTELADCYANVQDFQASVKYARAAQNLDLTNLKAIYYLGAGLKKTGDPLGAYEVLKDVRKLKGTAAEKNEFYGLAMFELESLERKVQEEAKAQTPHESLVEQTPKAVREELEDLSERNNKKNKRGGSALGSLGMALAIGTMTGLASWFVGKGYTKVPQRKVSVYSIGLGVLVGGVTLAVKGIGKKN